MWREDAAGSEAASEWRSVLLGAMLFLILARSVRAGFWVGGGGAVDGGG